MGRMARGIQNRTLTLVDKLSAGNLNYGLDFFTQQPFCFKADGTYPPVGTANTPNEATSPAAIGGPINYEYSSASAQTLLRPVFVAGTVGLVPPNPMAFNTPFPATANAPTGGLDWSLDQVNAHNLEVVPGGNSSRGRFAFYTAQTAGSNPSYNRGSKAFFARLNMMITTAAGSTFGFGLRGVQAYQATPTGYNDFIIVQSIAGVFSVSFQAAGGGVTTVTPNVAETSAALANWANGAYHEIRLECNVAGYAYGSLNSYAVRLLVDGAPLGGWGSYAFGSNLSVVPYFFQQQNATLSGVTPWNYFECGPLPYKAIGTV